MKDELLPCPYEIQCMCNLQDPCYPCETYSRYLRGETEHRLNTRQPTRERLQLAIAALEGLKRGDCFCEMAIGNPMIKSHTEDCVNAQLALKEIKNDIAK